MKLKCLLAGTLAICLGINSNVVVFAKKSEYVKDLQHKIDKALESDPSYEELIEIRDDYDELLKSEQEQIKNYDKIKEMFTVSEEVVAGVFAANALKERLKNPSSLKILSAGYSSSYDEIDKEYGMEDVMGAVVKLDYTATNDMGGEVEDTYYCWQYVPVEEDGKWTCKYNDIFWSLLPGEAMGNLAGSDEKSQAQKMAEEQYNDYEIIELEPEQIMDNIDMDITVLKNE